MPSPWIVNPRRRLVVGHFVWKPAFKRFAVLDEGRGRPSSILSDKNSGHGQDGQSGQNVKRAHGHVEAGLATSGSGFINTCFRQADCAQNREGKVETVHEVPGMIETQKAGETGDVRNDGQNAKPSGNFRLRPQRFRAWPIFQSAAVVHQLHGVVKLGSSPSFAANRHV